jgi:hypothetical protein
MMSLTLFFGRWVNNLTSDIIACLNILRVRYQYFTQAAVDKLRRAVLASLLCHWKIR